MVGKIHHSFTPSLDFKPCMLANTTCRTLRASPATVLGRFGPIPVRTPGRFGPIPFRSGHFGLGRFGQILEVGRFGPILVGRFGPLYII